MKTIIRIIHFLKENLLLILPFLIWSFCFRKFYPGSLVLEEDSIEYFDRIKYYFDNLVRGVYPLWDPFFGWGRPDILNVRMFDEFNPFIYLILLLNRIGVSFSLAFFIFMITYFLFGLLGFYLLSKRIFQERRLAYLSLLLLMFSSLGATFFNSGAIILLFVPVTWFFYFFVAFTQTLRKEHFLGAVFACMIIETTYIPFFFLTVFLTFLLTFCILFYKDFKAMVFRYIQFFRNHKFLTFFAILSILLACLPALFWFKEGGGGEYFVAWRHAGSPLKNAASMSYDTVSSGGVIGLYSFHDLFSNLKDGYFGMFYVPIFSYLILLTCVFTRLSRRSILFFVTGVFLFLIAMTRTTPVHRFLYDHVFFFKYFRNLQFLLWAVLPFLVLFLVEQTRLLLSCSVSKKGSRILATVFVFFVHVGFWLFLRHQEYIVISSYFTVVLSFLFFVCHFWGAIPSREKVWLILFLVLVILQPLEVFHYLGKNMNEGTMTYEEEQFVPSPAFVRPLEETKHRQFSMREVRQVANPAETSGLLGGEDLHRYIGVKATYYFHQALKRSRIKDYTKYKFILYDRVEEIDSESPDWGRLETFLAENRNVAFVSDADRPVSEEPLTSPGPLAQKIEENSDEFELVRFDLNEVEIKTNFPVLKFLVYNDSFHSGWRAFINGKKEKIVRANVAFKGIWIPAGENTIHFRFGSPVRYYFTFSLLIFFFVYLFSLLYMFGHKSFKTEFRKDQ